MTVSKWDYLLTALCHLCLLHWDCKWVVIDTDHTRWHCYLIFCFIIGLHFLVAMCSLHFTGKWGSGAMWAQLCPRSPCLWNNPLGSCVILLWPPLCGFVWISRRCSYEVLTIARLACRAHLLVLDKLCLPMMLSFTWSVSRTESEICFEQGLEP